MGMYKIIAFFENKLCGRMAWVWVPVLPLNCSVTLGNLFSLDMQKVNNSVYLIIEPAVASTVPGM